MRRRGAGPRMKREGEELIEGESGFAGVADRVARRDVRPVALLCALAGALALVLAFGAGSASAKLVWQGQYAFGTDGTSATKFENAWTVTYQQAEDMVYVYTASPTSTIRKYHRLGPGEYTPVGGNFPV